MEDENLADDQAEEIFEAIGGIFETAEEPAEQEEREEEGEEDGERRNGRRRGPGFLLGVVLGAAAGAAFAWLSAPTDEKDTGPLSGLRATFRNAAQEGRDAADEKEAELRSRYQDLTK